MSKKVSNVREFMVASKGGEGSPEIAINKISPDPDQPRKTFGEGELKELAATIFAHGIIQPLVLRPAAKAGHYIIIAGERRYRAAQLAGLKTVPAVVKDVPMETVRAMALIENLQRVDLPLMESAQAVEGALPMFKSKGALADALGQTAAWVSLRLGMLTLPDPVKRMHERGLTVDPQTLRGLGKLYEQSKPVFDVFDNEQIAITRANVNKALRDLKVGEDEEGEGEGEGGEGEEPKAPTGPTHFDVLIDGEQAAMLSTSASKQKGAIDYGQVIVTLPTGDTMTVDCRTQTLTFVGFFDGIE